MTSLGLAIAVLAVVSCASTAGRDDERPVAQTHRRGLGLEVHEPSDATSSRVVVVAVHGCCGDRRDLAGMSRALARRGAVVVNVDIHSRDDGGGWPRSYIDVVCALAWAQENVVDDDAEIAVLGWGDGALIASAVVFGWWEISSRAGGCTSPVPRSAPVTILVGISGHYGWSGDVPDRLRTPDVEAWFGGSPESEPEGWEFGNPTWWLAHPWLNGDLRAVVIGMLGDGNSELFGLRLAEAGIHTDVTMFESGTHGELIQPRGSLGRRALAVLVESLGLTSASGP